MLVLVAGLGLSACGGIEGARYTIDGVGTFSPTAQPERNMTLSMYGSWRDGSSAFPSFGDSKQTSFSVPAIAVGP